MIPGRHDGLEVVVDDEPLVRPPGELAGALEDRAVALDVGLVGEHPVDGGVVEAQECQVELGDDEVLVVATITDLRLAAAARQVAVEVVVRRDAHTLDGSVGVVALGGRAADLELRSLVEVRGLGRRLAVEGRAVAVDRVEVERRLAEVAQAGHDVGGRSRDQRVGGDVADRVVAVGVGGEVVVDELAPVGVDRRDGRVARRLQRVRLERRVLHHRGAEELERGDHLRRRGVRQVVRREAVGEVLEQVAERRAHRLRPPHRLVRRVRVLTVGEVEQDLPGGRPLSQRRHAGPPCPPSQSGEGQSAPKQSAHSRA